MSEGECFLTSVFVPSLALYSVWVKDDFMRDLIKTLYCIAYGFFFYGEGGYILPQVEIAILAIALMFAQWRTRRRNDGDFIPAFNHPILTAPSGLDMSKEFGP